MSVTTITTEEVYLKQGRAATWAISVKDSGGTPYDFSVGYTGHMQVRERANSRNFLDELTSTNSRITFDDGADADGINCRLIWSDEDSDVILATDRRREKRVTLLGDLEITETSTGNVVASVAMSIIFEQSVTHSSGTLEGVGYWTVT